MEQIFRGWPPVLYLLKGELPGSSDWIRGWCIGKVLNVFAQILVYETDSDAGIAQNLHRVSSI